MSKEDATNFRVAPTCFTCTHNIAIGYINCNKFTFKNHNLNATWYVCDSWEYDK